MRLKISTSTGSSEEGNNLPYDKSQCTEFLAKFAHYSNSPLIEHVFTPHRFVKFLRITSCKPNASAQCINSLEREGIPATVTIRDAPAIGIFSGGGGGGGGGVSLEFPSSTIY